MVIQNRTSKICFCWSFWVSLVFFPLRFTLKHIALTIFWTNPDDDMQWIQRHITHRCSTGTSHWHWDLLHENFYIYFVWIQLNNGSYEVKMGQWALMIDLKEPRTPLQLNICKSTYIFGKEFKNWKSFSKCSPPQQSEARITMTKDRARLWCWIHL